ncbi:hypothetical protein BJX76DRAFT_274842 [Aspergillus varians]
MKTDIPPVVIGIDFGATSSSAAFALAKPEHHEIKVLDKWPEAMSASCDQIPRRRSEIQSVVYYMQWGIDMVGWSGGLDEVFTPQGSLKSCVVSTLGFKSQFLPPPDYPEGQTMGFPLVRDKSVEEIMVDYLRCLRVSVCEQTRDQLEAKGLDVEMGGRDMRFVITVPAFWGDGELVKFRKVARAAGFHSNDDKDKALSLSFISGLEAALLYADEMNHSTFNVGDAFLVIDCGGHLVEAATYEVKSKSPLKVERRTPVSVGSCGSAEATRLFMNIARRKINKALYPKLGRAVGSMRYKVKRAFEKDMLLGDGLYKPSVQFEPLSEVPSGFLVADVGIEKECPEADLAEGYMLFSEQEICPCFNTVVERAVGIVREQIEAVQGWNGNGKLQGCLLVGGFNKCEYFSSRLQDAIASHGLSVIRPDDDGAAFARGAVLAGLTVDTKRT